MNVSLNSFKRNLRFIIAILIQHTKVLREYKTNFYLVFISHITFMIITSFTFFVLKKQFSTLFYWNIYEYLFFLILLEIGVFLFIPWFRRLQNSLITGKFNVFLLRPIHVFIGYAFSRLELFILLIGILYIFILGIYMVFLIPFVDLGRLFICLLLLLFGGIFSSAQLCFIDSLAFFMKENKFLRDLKGTIETNYSQFPMNFFAGSFYEKLGYLVATGYLAVMTTQYYFGYISLNVILILFLILVLFISILSFLSFLLWRQGLKSYEAFG